MFCECNVDGFGSLKGGHSMMCIDTHNQFHTWMTILTDEEENSGGSWWGVGVQQGFKFLTQTAHVWILLKNLKDTQSLQNQILI